MLSNKESATPNLSGDLQETLKKIEANWPVLPSGLWNSSSIQILTRHLHALSKNSEQAGLGTLYELTQQMDEMIHGIIDEDTPPGDAQIETLNKSLERLKEAVAGAQWPLPGAKSRDIDLLLLYRNQEALEQIERAVVRQEWQSRTCANLAELRSALGDGAKTTLIDTVFLPELNQHPEILEPGTDGAPALFFVSHHCSIETRLQAMRAGAIHLFPEPIDPGALIEALGEYIHPQLKPRHRVLIVDDDEAQANFAAELLRKAALDTLIITDPLSVIDAVWRFQPDLILMDLNMPGADGIELTRLIRDREASLAIPIVFLSSEEDQEKKLLALRAGADGFLTKPVRPQQLLATVTTRIQRAQTIRAAGPREKADVAELSSRRALLSRLDLAHREPEADRQFQALLVISLGDLQASPTPWRWKEDDRLITITAESLKSLLREDDYPARIGYRSLAVLIRRPTEQEIKHVANLAYDSVRLHLNESAPPEHRLGIGLTLLDGVKESAYTLLKHGESVATSAHQQSLKGYLLYREQIESTKEQTKNGAKSRRKAFLLSLRNGLVTLAEQPLTGQGKKTTQTLEMIPRSTSKTPDNLYQTAGLCETALEFDCFVCKRSIERLAKYALQGKSVRLIFRQSAAVLGEKEYLDFIKSELRRLQIVGTGLMTEFDLPSLASDLKRTRALFSDLAALGIGVALGNVACNETTFKVLAYLKADAARPPPSLLQMEAEKIGYISRQIHSLGTEIILPLMENPGQIAPQWLQSADYIQSTYQPLPWRNLLQ